MTQHDNAFIARRSVHPSPPLALPGRARTRQPDPPARSRGGALRLLLDLALGRFSRRDGLDEFKHRFKFAVRSLCVLPFMLRWLDTFLGHPVLLAYLRQNPRVAAKLHRPYLSRRVGTRSKLEVLQAHYRLECERFPAPLLHALLAGETLDLATVQGKDARAYALRLTHQHSFDKEGELSLQLITEDGIPLVTLTFSMTETATGAKLVIGGLQGPRRSEGDAEVIRAATKAFHGLFPKRVIIEALYAIAQALGPMRIIAIGKARHIYNAWRYRRHFEADYDGFWLALGASEDKPALFFLPIVPHRKPMEDIASKKRAEYQRRYALLDDLDAQIAGHFRTARHRPPVC